MNGKSEKCFAEAQENDRADDHDCCDCFLCLLLVAAAGIVIIPNLGKFSIPEVPDGYRYNGIASAELQEQAIN
ncbi:MAG: hypothetical protein IPL71_15760 [Anaerolineales bacterium]|uniref:hypothetical protein n=1 Tax=Candidatus Villigracilis proximus TaxID=3140683 RepID=UPI003136DD89|nr:hypothetical protein [Anaerolineales bacterium]